MSDARIKNAIVAIITAARNKSATGHDSGVGILYMHLPNTCIRFDYAHTDGFTVLKIASSTVRDRTAYGSLWILRLAWPGRTGLQAPS